MEKKSVTYRDDSDSESFRHPENALLMFSMQIQEDWRIMKWLTWHNFREASFHNQNKRVWRRGEALWHPIYILTQKKSFWVAWKMSLMSSEFVRKWFLCENQIKKLEMEYFFGKTSFFEWIGKKQWRSVSFKSVPLIDGTLNKVTNKLTVISL